MDYIKDVHFEMEGAKAVKEAVSMLSDSKVRSELGRGSSDILLNGIKSYVNKERGVRKSQLVKGLDKVRSAGVQALLGSIGQLPKQFVPAVVQSYALVNGNPRKYAKALTMLAKLDDDWYRKNAPGLYERKLSMDRLTFGGDEAFFRNSGS